MKVAVVSEVAPGTPGGVTTLYRYMIPHLFRQGHRLAFIGPRGIRPLPAEFVDVRFPCRLLPSFGFPLNPEVRVSPILGRRAVRFLETTEPDVLHLVDPFVLGPQASAWARQHGIPVLASFHTNIPAYTPYYALNVLRRAVWRLLRRAYRHADLVLAPTCAMQHVLETNGFGRVACWGRGVDTGLFKPDRRSRSLRARLLRGGKASIALYVGRIAKEKEVQFLIDSLLPSRRLQLVLVGDGPALSKLRTRYEKQGVFFAGFVGGVDLARYYASADVFVFASQTDTYGQVLNEALASGLPVVAADSQGIREVMSVAASCTLYRPGDAAGLRETVQDLLSDPERCAQLGRLGREVAMKRDWEAAMRHLFLYYGQLIRGEYPRPGRV